MASATKEFARRNRARVTASCAVALPSAPAGLGGRAWGSGGGGALGNLARGASSALVPAGEQSAHMPSLPSQAMNHRSVGDVWLGLRNKDGGALQAAPVMPQEETDAVAERLPPDIHSPLAAGALDAIHLDTIERGSTIKQVSQECLDKFSRFCKAEPRLSGPTAYPTMCGAMCKDPHRTPLWVTKMRGEMVAHFKLLVEACGGAKATMRDELIVLIQGGDGGKVAARFFTIAACLSQSGPRPAAQVFAESCLEKPVAIDPTAPSQQVAGVLAGLRLTLREGPSREMMPSRPMPPVFDATKIADVLDDRLAIVLVQAVLARPSSRLDTIELTGANVARDKLVVLLPKAHSMPKPRGDIDLFDAIRPQRPQDIEIGGHVCGGRARYRRWRLGRWRVQILGRHASGHVWLAERGPACGGARRVRSGVGASCAGRKERCWC